MSVEEYELKYDDFSDEELVDEFAFKAAFRQQIMNSRSLAEERKELSKQIKAIKAVIIKRIGGKNND